MAKFRNDWVKVVDFLKSRDFKNVAWKFDRGLISHYFALFRTNFGSRASRNLCLVVFYVQGLKLVQTSGYASSIKS